MQFNKKIDIKKYIAEIGTVIDTIDLICSECWEKDRCDERCDTFWELRDKIFLEEGEGIYYDESMNKIILVYNSRIYEIEPSILGDFTTI